MPGVMLRGILNEKERKNLRTPDQVLTIEKVVCTALVGIGVIAVIELLGTPLDSALTFSLYCFAISIPFLAAYSLILASATRHEQIVGKWYLNIVGIVGIVAAFVGVGAIFWHFNWAIGLLFVGSSLFAFMAWLAFDAAIRRSNG